MRRIKKGVIFWGAAMAVVMASGAAAQRPEAEGTFDRLKVPTQADFTGATLLGFDVPLEYPQGPEGKLHPNHAGVVDIVQYVAKGGNDAWRGSMAMPKKTVKAAIEHISAENPRGTRIQGTVFVGPGEFIELPLGVTSNPLGQAFRIIGSGTNATLGTDLVLHESATGTDDFLTFESSHLHNTLIKDLRLDMKGRGRDAINFGPAGFHTKIENVVFLRVPRWCINNKKAPITLWLENVGATYSGFGKGSGSEAVSFADAGGGNYQITDVDEVWLPGNVARLDSHGTFPTGYERHKDYYWVSDGGTLRLSDTLGGEPLAASNAGSGAMFVMGGNRIMDTGPVTFADVGGGDFHLVNPLPREWEAGDAVRVSSTGIMPGGLSGGVTYWLIDSGGDLILSDSQGGLAFSASSAGTGNVRLETAFDSSVHGGFMFLDNSASSSLSQWSINGMQLDSVGAYPIYVDEQTTTIHFSMFSVSNVETEVRFSGNHFVHDALIAVRGESGDAPTAILLDNVTMHNHGGGVNAMKAIVKQLDRGPSTVQISARNLRGNGAQYDFLFMKGDQTTLVDFENQVFFGHGAPIIYHGDAATDVAFKAGWGIRPSGSGHSHPAWQVLGDGSIQMGTGQAAPTTRFSISASGNLVVSGLPTSDPGQSGALWNDEGTLKVSD